jgi:hypothetical protein
MKKFAFIGSANALGMMYALELRKMGHVVEYIVTTDSSDALSRPENHYPEILFPYDDWIFECFVKNPLRANLFPRWYLSRLIERIDGFDYVILSGMYLMLAPYFKRAKPVFLSHGSDLDIWCNKDNYLYHVSKMSSVKSFGRSVASIFGIFKMRRAFLSCVCLITFPVGLSPKRDSVFRSLTTDWQGDVFYRFDISFLPLLGIDRNPPGRADKLVLLCAVRCSFIEEPGVSPSDMKGVDHIIRGVADYINMGRLPVEFHIVEKGKDLHAAKRLCHELGIDDYVIWHREMPFNKLLSLYKNSDVCFDQVSTSWLGAIGCYAMYLGRPLIANSRKDILCDLMWTEEPPICEAVCADDITKNLIRLEEKSVRADVSERSKIFAEKYLGPSVVANQIARLGGVK